MSTPPATMVAASHRRTRGLVTAGSVAEETGSGVAGAVTEDVPPSEDRDGQLRLVADGLHRAGHRPAPIVRQRAAPAEGDEDRGHHRHAGDPGRRGEDGEREGLVGSIAGGEGDGGPDDLAAGAGRGGFQYGAEVHLDVRELVDEVDVERVIERHADGIEVDDVGGERKGSNGPRLQQDGGGREQGEQGEQSQGTASGEKAVHVWSLLSLETRKGEPKRLTSCRRQLDWDGVPNSSTVSIHVASSPAGGASSYG